MKRVLIIAGETSGDLHGSQLMNRMKILLPGIEFKGIGGSLMIEEGLDTIRHVREMNFMGFVEVIRHLPFIRRTMKDLEALLDSWHPDLAILIDYPGFNLRFAPAVKRRNIPLMYYISPQLWAWHKSRVKIVERYVDRMVVLFDFERDFYHRCGITADFVGHPLVDIVRPVGDHASFRSSLGANDSLPVIGLLPGSRTQEIDRLLPAMIGAFNLLRQRHGPVCAVIGCASEIEQSYYETFIGGTDIIPLREKTYDIMAHADALVVSSGTATLESGILGTPMVIVYRTSPLTNFIGRRLVKIPDIGLINIVAGTRIVPELLQDEVTPGNIAGHLGAFLEDVTLRESTKKALASAGRKLGESGASERAARIALDMMGAGSERWGDGEIRR